MSLFNNLVGLFNGGSKDSQGKETNTTERNNDKNFLDNLSDGLSEGWKSITSVFPPSKPSPELNNNPKQNDSISVAKKAELKARESALQAQKLINHSRREHENQFQIGKLSNPPQAGQKRKEPDSGFDQDPSKTKKSRSKNLESLTPTELWQKDGIVASPKKIKESTDKSIDRAEWQVNKIRIEGDNRDGHLSRHGNHFGLRNPEVWKGESSLAGRPNPHDRLWQGENFKSLERSRSESSLIAMKQAQEVAAGLKKSEKRDGKSLRDASYQLGRYRTNVLSRGGSSGR